MKYVVLALLMLAAGLGLMHIEREPQFFTPLVRVRTTDGLFMTYVHRNPVSLIVCEQTVKTFTAVTEKSCPACVVESTACSQKLEGLDGALARNERVPLYTVDGNGFRVAMVGPPETVVAECREMASQMLSRGITTAACHMPGAGGSPKG